MMLYPLFQHTSEKGRQVLLDHTHLPDICQIFAGEK